MEFEDEVRIGRIRNQIEDPGSFQTRKELAVGAICIPMEGFREETTICSCVGNKDASGRRNGRRDRSASRSRDRARSRRGWVLCCGSADDGQQNKRGPEDETYGFQRDTILSDSLH